MEVEHCRPKERRFVETHTASRLSRRPPRPVSRSVARIPPAPPVKGSGLSPGRLAHSGRQGGQMGPLVRARRQGRSHCGWIRRGGSVRRLTARIRPPVPEGLSWRLIAQPALTTEVSEALAAPPSLSAWTRGSVGFSFGNRRALARRWAVPLPNASPLLPRPACPGPVWGGRCSRPSRAAAWLLALFAAAGSFGPPGRPGWPDRQVHYTPFGLSMLLFYPFFSITFSDPLNALASSK